MGGWLRGQAWRSTKESREVGVVLFNHGAKTFFIKKGGRIAQMVFENISNPAVVEVDSLDDTLRGPGAFGSTGV